MAVLTRRLRRFGAELVRLRTKVANDGAGMDRAQAAALLDVSVGAITQWENGSRKIKPLFLKTLLNEYGVPAEEQEPLLAVARIKDDIWWSGASVRPSFMSYVAMENEASVVEEFSATLIPGLAQTEAYARGVMEAAFQEADEDVIQSRVDVRMRRQKRLHEAPVVRLHLVLDEGAIRRQVGGDKVWREQLLHLGELARRRNVTVQVLPYSVGAHASMLGGFTILTFPDDDPPIVYEERLMGDVLTEGSDAARFRLLFDALREQALPPELSWALLEKVANESG